MIQRPYQRRRSRKPLVIITIIIMLALGAGAWALLGGEQPEQSNNAKSDTAQKPAEDTHKNRIRLIAGGDIVAHDSVNANAKRADGGYDYYDMMDRMKPLFDNADIRFCNQVTPAGGTEYGITGYPKFNAPTELVRDLGKLGCNTVNMASNHSFDNSQDAISANVRAWKNVPNVLAAAGQNQNQAEHDTVHTFTVKGVKIAFLAYTTYINNDAPATNSYGVNSYSRSFASQQISEAKKQGAEIIITSMRWGTEYSASVNAQQKSEAQFLADQGVDVILGHGPHVLQPVATLTGADNTQTVVWYSLGNFLNTQLEAEGLFNGLAVMDFDTQTKKLTNSAYLPVYMHYAWSAADAKAEKLLARQDLELYALDDATPELIQKHQLDTTIDEQRSRIQNTLNSSMAMPLISKNTYLN